MKKCINLIVLLCCMILFGNVAYGIDNEMIYKNAVYSDITAYINGLPIPSYNIGGRTYVFSNELEKYGFELNYVNEKRCLYIDYNPTKEVTADYDITKDNKKIGSVAFYINVTDIYAEINGHNPHKTFYSANEQLLIDMSYLENVPNSYVIWSLEEKSIRFDTLSYWSISPNFNEEKQKTENISNFYIEMNKNQQGEFKAKGRNEQYFDINVMWCEAKDIKDFSKDWFGNTKVCFNLLIHDDKIQQTEELMKLLNSIVTINSEGDAVKSNINEHISVFINGEKIAVSEMELEPNFGYCTYHFELDTKITNSDDIQTMTIECK